ncbi:hypothetical protein [Fontibacillus phaseoli]|uniref:hypothetical protein n=1 Tax=Fontibacillus phaseoli TaxID=1416533 RepID=UPI0015F09416|nr:hypothetical protein [Fontibacillus phaseoli]
MDRLRSLYSTVIRTDPNRTEPIRYNPTQSMLLIPFVPGSADLREINCISCI